MTDQRVHPETGKLLRRDVRRQIVRFGSLAREVDVPGWYPEGDGDGLHSGSDLAASNAAYKELRSAYATRVRTVRKRLGLTQEEAGRIIGGGKRAFQKYESGATPPSDAAVGLIEVLDRQPQEIETLRRLRSDGDRPQPVMESTPRPRAGPQTAARPRRGSSGRA